MTPNPPAYVEKAQGLRMGGNRPTAPHHHTHTRIELDYLRHCVVACIFVHISYIMLSAIPLLRPIRVGYVGKPKVGVSR